MAVCGARSECAQTGTHRLVDWRTTVINYERRYVSAGPAGSRLCKKTATSKSRIAAPTATWIGYRRLRRSWFG